ncbi:nicotinamide-nucleotide adenylyltransferase [Pyrodictium delaneyi]|uniref:Nicotinamide-nucleotide adenylyltransferase n=1 Tax=Pyrodictium delaneyi TaxID=1273541 RepID=A0A0P0N246_9CREN|nr:nicotinamide-nucleotide adenylyltransferase [Pyrodictium delaneyi]ALL00530.1 nicotinamide-nucleotide adenylyltransferase [Pyrodictium delaneyi]OWJ53995.1 nicotinamide-nucleotide adenylyltransferase [Pyrodictium delaneyi]
MSRGVFVGRFQPPHWGHIEVIKWCLDRVDELIIVVGSAQESHTLKNPFTAGERIEMLLLGLRDAAVDTSRVMIVPVPDIAMNHVWPRYLEMLLPRFHVVFSRNPLVTRLFTEYGYRVESPPAFSRGEYSATRIRSLMLRGDESWKRLVPPSVARFIEEIKGVERLVTISGRD